MYLLYSWFIVSAFDCFGFFNCGKESGASQAHKHLQMIPLPLEKTSDPTARFPLETLIRKNYHGKVKSIVELILTITLGKRHFHYFRTRFQTRMFTNFTAKLCLSCRRRLGL